MLQATYLKYKRISIYHVEFLLIAKVTQKQFKVNNIIIVVAPSGVSADNTESNMAASMTVGRGRLALKLFPSCLPLRNLQNTHMGCLVSIQECFSMHIYYMLIVRRAKDAWCS